MKLLKKRGLVLTVMFLFILVVISYIFYQLRIKQEVKSEDKENNPPLVENKDNINQSGCSRTSRLDNKPTFDRALSIIQEKYSLFEKNGSVEGIYYFFPSQLVNCIKIIEDNVRSQIGAEGLFVFNSEDIKDNYYPITVDKDYSSTDDLTNSLLLVHEITHVRQYVELNTAKDNLSCIDKEVEAFLAMWKFFGFMNTENWKTVDLKIRYDNDLNPQLQVLKNLRDNDDLEGIRIKCLKGAGNSDSNCIDDFRKNEFRQMLLQDDFYKKECKL